MEVALDTSVAETTVTPGAGAGLYDLTGDRVYVLRRDNQFGVITRSDFGRPATSIVSTALQAPVQSYPVLTGKSAVVLADGTNTRLALVNYAAPGKELGLTTTTLTLDIAPTRIPLDIAGP
jgi:hypothetical protein